MSYIFRFLALTLKRGFFSSIFVNCHLYLLRNCSLCAVEIYYNKCHLRTFLLIIKLLSIVLKFYCMRNAIQNKENLFSANGNSICKLSCYDCIEFQWTFYSFIFDELVGLSSSLLFDSIGVEKSLNFSVMFKASPPLKEKNTIHSLFIT